MVADGDGGVEREELKRESGRGRKARGRGVGVGVGRLVGSLEVDALMVLLKRKDMAVVMTVFSKLGTAKVEFASLERGKSKCPGENGKIPPADNSFQSVSGSITTALFMLSAFYSDCNFWVYLCSSMHRVLMHAYGL